MAVNPRSMHVQPWLKAALCVLLVHGLPVQAAGTVPAPVALVQSLYESYAWEAVVSKPRGRALFQEPAGVLRRYFDEPLARLILANQDCERRTREVCRLEMMPLWNSSDPAASELHVEAAGTPGEVRVRFLRPGETAWTEISFLLNAQRGVWRIRDIRYAGGASLVRMLPP